jgi:hypothetical protein
MSLKSYNASDILAEIGAVRDDFQLRSLGDELRVDRLCQVLLRRYYEQLLQDGMAPEEATRWASGADYYLRDFVVDNRRMSVFDERPGVVRRFAGNWYIVNTIEPRLPELMATLQGVAGFYRFLQAHGLISAAYLTQVEAECGDNDYYAGRIASFWAITGDGYLAWERECGLK